MANVQTYEDQRKHLPSLWQIGDAVSVTFPGAGLIKVANVIKVAFDKENAFYDVEIAYRYFDSEDEYPKFGHARIHGLKEWHLRLPDLDEPLS